ncbi:MAG: leucine-rich repeat protein, partial [Oscillospiraceae bacterium]|nr:leucine-rich repeat protein [Oscillospiraceae bacterium]
MKKRNKLVALLLAAVMVLGMMPAMAPHAHADGIEDYPAIAADTPANATIANGGDIAYFTFTPATTDLYYFYSENLESYVDTVGAIYSADMEQINYNDDSTYGDTLGIYSPNFCMAQMMEAGTTYVLTAKAYNANFTGDFSVTVKTGHEYESVVTKEASCSADGELTYTCKHCGESYTEVIPAAHSYSDEDGKCIYCGEAYLVTGECGDDLIWELDWFGTLTVKGTGAMYNYSVSYSENYPAPWYDYKGDITALVVEEGVTSIGNYALYNCQEMTEVSLPESLTALGTNSFASCYGLTEIQLPNGITEIPDSCFKYCGELTDIIWPEKLTAIGSNAFYSCALSDLIVPEGVTTIGQYAFGSNGSMSKLTLPSTLTTLSDYAFASMYSTKDFVFTGGAPVFDGSSVFYYVNANAWYPLGNETWTDEVKQNYGGTITWQGICSGSHTWGDPVTVPATCETGSYMTMTCTICGYTTVSPENDDALGHDYQYEHYNGGCDNYSYDITTCSRCDYYATENMVWNEHSWDEGVVTEATCTENGYTTYTCTLCGWTNQMDWVYAQGHSVTEWSEPSEATCTEDGVKTGACANCGETVSEVVTPALGHTWDEENGTANEDGTMTYKCIRCDATYTTEGDFLYEGDNLFTIAGSTGRRTKTYTATADGKLTISMNDMFYHNAYAWDNGWIDQYWQTLALDWAFGEGAFNVYVNDMNMSYTVEGSETASKIIFTTVEVKAGDVVEVEVNHTESSYQYEYDVQFNMNLALEAVHTHTEEVIPGKPATFDEPGLTEGKKCSECGEILVEQEEIAKLDYNEGIVPVNVLTATAGDSYSSDIPANVLDDDFATMWHTNWYGTSSEGHWIQFELSDAYAVDGLRYKPRTDKNRQDEPQLNGTITEYQILVSNDGVTFEEIATGNWDANQNWKTVEFEAQTVKYIRLVSVNACTDNQYVFASAAEIRLTGEKDETVCTHENTEIRNDKAATCTEDGYTGDTYCAECGEKLATGETIPATGHTEEIIPGKDATCTEPGLTEGKKCTVCGVTTVEQEVIPALGHEYVNGKCTRCGDTLTSKFEDV